MADRFTTLPNGLYVGIRDDGSMYTAQQPGATGKHFDLAVDPTTQHSYVGSGGDQRYLPTTSDLQAAHDKSGFVSSYDFDPKTAGLKRSTNWANLVGVGAVAAPLAAAVLPSVGGLLAGGGSASAGAGGAAGAAGAGGASAASGATSMFSIPWGDIFKYGTQVGGSLYGAHAQTSAADHAADIEAQAARYAADQQTQATREALDFSKSQAENAYLNTEATRRANYDQWAAREGRLAAAFQAKGWGDRAIPGYVPGVDPQFTSAGAALAGRVPVAPVTAPIPVGMGQTPAAAASAGRYLVPNFSRRLV